MHDFWRRNSLPLKLIIYIYILLFFGFCSSCDMMPFFPKTSPQPPRCLQIRLQKKSLHFSGCFKRRNPESCFGSLGAPSHRILHPFLSRGDSDDVSGRVDTYHLFAGNLEKIKRLTLKRKRSEHTLNQKWTLYNIINNISI